MFQVYDENSGAHGRPDHWHFLQEPRYFPDLSQAPRESTVLDLRRSDINWRSLADYPELEEVTGQGLSREQLEFLVTLPRLKRLRLSGLRALDIASLGQAAQLEELALISISGVRSLEPLVALPRLRSLFVESIPKLTDFSALRGATGLKCLCITSGSELAQKIEDLSFLSGMAGLQHLMLGHVRHLGLSPAFFGLESLPNLVSMCVFPAFMPLEDIIYLQVRLRHIKGVETRTFIIQGGGERDLPLENLDRLPPDKNVSVYFAGKGEREFYGPAPMAKTAIEKHLERAATFKERYHILA